MIVIVEESVRIAQSDPPTIYFVPLCGTRSDGTKPNLNKSRWPS